jgi:hypothetical protein
VASEKPTAGNFNWLMQQVGNISQAQAFQFEAVGNLQAIGAANLGMYRVLVATTITAIALTCATTPASGTITIDILTCASGGTPTSLYSVNPKPTLTCNGGYASAVSANVPDTVALAVGDLLFVRLSGTPPAGAYDLQVAVY